MRKQIAIFGWKTGENSYGVTIPYYDYFDHFGDVNILSPVDEVDFAKYNLLVVPGGPDVAPNTYGHIPSMFTQKSDPIKEYFDAYLLPEAIKVKIPIIGICRGNQAVGVHFEASIIQSMYHETNLNSDRAKKVHGIDVFTNVLSDELADAIKKELGQRKGMKHNPNIAFQEVNSMHHQALSDVPIGARLLASHFDEKRPKDKTIEALYYPDHNIFTFQYHPEEIWDALSMICISYLLSDKKKKHEPNRESSEVSV